MSNVHDSVSEKVQSTFRELAGDRARSLEFGRASDALEALAAALTEEHGAWEAREIAFHLADWNYNAAFLVAWLLYPERFTPEELAAGTLSFLLHAPSHIRAACKLTGEESWVDFYEDNNHGTES